MNRCRGRISEKNRSSFFRIFNELKIPVPDIEHFINVYKNYYFDFIDESNIYPGQRDTGSC
jgi:hypothetical protein